MNITNILSRVLIAFAALGLGACTTPPKKDIIIVGELAKKLEEKSPASARVLKIREGGEDLNDAVRLTTITDWCDISPDGASCRWKTNFHSMTYDPFARAFLLGFTGGGFVGITQLAGVNLASKRAASNCPENSFCGGTMVTVEGATAVSGSEASSVAGAEQKTVIGTKKP